MKQYFSWATIITLVVVIAIGFRLPFLNASFWLDEAAQALESSRPLEQQLDIIPDFQPPLLHLILHFATYTAKSEWWLRTWGALIPGVLSIVCAVLAARLSGASKLTGFLAGLWLSLSSFHIFYSQELRPYSLPMLWASLSWLVLLKITSKPSSPWWWLGFSVATTLGLYSSYIYPFLVLSQLAWLAITHREKLLPLILSLAGAGLLFLPWLPTLRLQLAAGQTVQIELPGWSQAVSSPLMKALPLTAAKLLFGVVDLEFSLGWIVMGLSLLLLLGACTVIVGTQVSKLDATTRRRILAFSLWLGVPIITSWLFSWYIPVLQPKRVLFVQPALFLLLAELCSLSFFYLRNNVKLLNHHAKTIAIVTMIVISAAQLYGTVSYWTDPKLQRENWKEAIEIITESQNSAAIMSFYEPFAPWIWYADYDFPVFTTTVLSTDSLELETLRQTLKPATEYQTLYVFDYLSDLTDSSKKTHHVVRDFGYQESHALDYPGIGFIRVFVKGSVVAEVNQLAKPK